MADNLDTRGAVAAYLNDKTATTEVGMRHALDVGLAANPDYEAELRKVARDTGVPIDSVRAYPDEAKRQAQMQAIRFNELATQFPRTASFLSGVENAKVAHDDIDNLSATEKALGFFKNTGNALLASVPAFNEGAWGIAQAGAEFGSQYITGPMNGAILPEDPLARAADFFKRQRQASAATKTGLMPRADNVAESGFYSGVQSTGQMLLTLPLAILSGNPELALAPMAGSVAGQAYGQARDQGLSVPAAANFGVSQGAIEYLTEKLPVGKLLGDLNAGTSFLRTLRNQAIAEVPGEQVATALQDLNEWAVLPENKDKTIKDYIEARPGAAAETLIATLVGVGGNVTVGKGVERAANLFGGRLNQAQRAEQGAATIEQLNQLAAASKLRARDADTFEQFVAQATEDAPLQSVFIDAKTLMQSGIAEQIAQVSPSVAEQLPAALAAGGDIAIPVAEYTARIAGTEFSQPLLDHLKTEPGGMSRAEAQVFMQNQAEELQAEVERVLSEKQADDTFKASAEAVKANIKQQLDTAGRFTPDVNEAYSTLVSNFYAVTGAKLGIAPEQLYGRYPLRVTADRDVGLGNVLEQKFAATTGDANDAAMQDLLAKPGQSKSVGQETGRMSKEGISRLKSPFGSTRYVYSEGGQAKAVLQIMSTDGQVGTIANVYTVPDARRKGIASQLMERARKDFKQIHHNADLSPAGAAWANSVEGAANTDNLVAIHNLSADNLRHAAELGGLAAPSLAIARKDIAFDSFGDVTLIGDKSLVNPAKNPVFNADVYSPRHPRAKTKVNERKASAGVDAINALVPDLARGIDAYTYADELQRDGLQGAYNRARYDLATKLAFAREALGQVLPIPTKQVVPQARPAGSKTLVEYEPLASLLNEINLREVNFTDVATSERIAGAMYAAMFNRHIELATERYAARDDMDSVEKNNAVLDEAETLTNRRIKMFTGEHDGKRIMTPEGLTKLYNLQRSAQAEAGMAVDAEVARTEPDLEALLQELNPLVDANLPALRTWIAEKFGAAVGDRYLEQYTRTGNVTRKPYTLENVVKAMTRELRGGEGFSYGVGSARSQGATKFTSIEQMRAAQDSLVAPAEFEQVKAGLNAKFNDIAARIGQAAGRQDFGAMDTLAEALGDSYKRGYTMRRALIDNGFENVPSDLVDEFQQFATEVVNAGTEYFEAKLQRAVDIGEFKAAAVPEGVDPDVLKILQDAGVQDIRTYKKGDAESRRAAIEGAAASGGLLFQNTYTADTIEVDGVSRPTTNSNGQRIAQTEEGLRNFWRWFGDSKVVGSGDVAQKAYEDAKAKVDFDNERLSKLPAAHPLRKVIEKSADKHVSDLAAAEKALSASAPPQVAYHGGGPNIESFRRSSGGRAIWAAESIVANTYAGQNTGATVYPVYLEISNPMVFDASGATWQDLSFEGERVSTDDLADIAEQRGFDGLVINNIRDEDTDSGGDTPATHYAVFNPTQIKSAIGNSGEFDPTNPSILNQEIPQGARGFFNPETNTIALLKKADLSTFLHESGHFFLETQIDIAAKLVQEASMFGNEMSAGERQLVDDTAALMKWFGLNDINEWFAMDFEQQRGFHEQFARGFEAYLFEGKAPSIELQGLFQRFRAWLVNIYRELKRLNVELTDEVRGVMDRMVATNEQIQLAEQARSMMPLFTSPEQAGMTVEEFAAYQALGTEATADAIDDLQARGLRDMQWLHNARGREIKKLQKRANALRMQVTTDVRREVMTQPLYRAWQFLTAKMSEQDKAETVEPKKAKSTPNIVDETQDSLFVAIAKLGGISREEVESTWGFDPKEKAPVPLFGKPVLRREGGRTIDGMLEVLAERGYLPVDENGKADVRYFEETFNAEYRGDKQYSTGVDPTILAPDMRAGEDANLNVLTAGRLDMTSLRDLSLPDEVISRLKTLRMTAENGGIHADIVAEMFGFDSGDRMARELALAERPADVINGMVDARMIEQHGELATPDAIERAADAAIHNSARARMIATEANALAKATGQRKILVKAAKDFASAMISRLKIREIRPSQYANAEARAARAAEKASRDGDVATAAAEKRNQLVQNYAAKSAYDAQEEIDKGLRYLKKFNAEGGRKSLSADYLDQIDVLLDRFDLRTGQSLTAIDKRKSLVEWVNAQREQGLEPDVPPDLLNEAMRKSYKDMTVEEFRGLVDTIKQIEHLGRLKQKLLTAKDQREYDTIVQSITDSINEHANGRRADTRTPTTNLGRALEGMRKFYTSHIKAASLARIMDGGQDGGQMWEYLIRSANERADQEATARAEATVKLSEILDPVMKRGKMGGKGQFFPSINRSLNREARIAIALNVGNEGNLQRLLGGEGWTLDRLMPVLESLTADEWQAVQGVWDHFESYRPQIGAKERRIYGKEPDWVEAGSPAIAYIADKLGVPLRGGYYPIKYDPKASQRAEEHSDAEEAKRQMQGAYTSATTRRSFTKSRAEEVVGRPLLYTLAGMYQGVNDVIHDLAWHEWLIDANRLMRSNRIDTAIRTQYGPEVKQQFKSWIQDIAGGDSGANAALDPALGYLRQSVSVAGLGFNVVSALMQPLGLTQSIVRVGAEWIARGVAEYVAGPRDAAKRVNEMSEFMRNRSRTRFRELNELRNQVQDQTAAKQFVQQNAYRLMMAFQSVVDVPTWLGAYSKAIADGNAEDRAVQLADQAVIDSQGGGETKDLSAIERGGPAQKLFTVFYSFMNTALNLVITQGMTEKRKAKLAADMLLLLVVPAVLGQALKDAVTPGGDEDEDWLDFVKKAVGAQIDYLFGLFVIAREFAGAAKIVTGTTEFGAQGYPGPAGVRMIGDVYKLGGQAAQGEIDLPFVKSFINVAGDLLGLPAAQINRTITGTNALVEGETENPAAAVLGFQR